MLFREAFERAAGEEAIVILISSKISGTLNAARIAKEEGGFDNVLLYDSLCTTAMQRILVEEAVRRRDRSAREAAEILDGLRPRLRLFAALDTLEYLYKGGRIKGGTALMGKLLGIKPVVELTVEGEVKNVGRAHGRKKALAEIKRLSEREKRDPAFSPYYLYCKTEAACDELTELTGERSARRQTGFMSLSRTG
ncbi:MAG: DegV family protein, partial [Candidatus Gallimonas sp.]